MPKTILKNAKRFKSSSQRWLKRQLNDPYVQQAQKQGYRSRAAFKLLEIQEKYKILHPRSRVIDLGCAPGGWSQVCRKLCPQGIILGVDLSPVESLEGVTFIQGDFCSEEVQGKILESLGGIGADGVLSDMAPPTIGDARTDHLRIMALSEITLDFAHTILKPGGFLVIKTRQGGTSAELLKSLKTSFKKVSHFKPPSSRVESSEMFVVAQEFRVNPS